jgi:hypothetical protein
METNVTTHIRELTQRLENLEQAQTTHQHHPVTNYIPETKSMSAIRAWEESKSDTSMQQRKRHEWLSTRRDIHQTDSFSDEVSSELQKILKPL